MTRFPARWSFSGGRGTVHRLLVGGLLFAPVTAWGQLPPASATPPAGTVSSAGATPSADTRSADTRSADTRSADATPSTDEGIVMRWSAPQGESPPALAAWYEENAVQIATLEHAWAGLLQRMGGHRPARFDSQCSGLVASLERLDEPALLPVPDPVIDLYVKRLLRHLHHAARACRAQELFNVVYHLEEARSSLGQMRTLLADRHVGAAPAGPGGL
jgi:hypothetical protein